MVEVKDIAKQFENILNTNTLGKNFKIFSNVGELKKNTKRQDEYRNGLVEYVSSSVSNIENLQFLTISTNLTLFVNLDLRGNNEDGENLECIEIYQILNDFISQYNWKTFNETFGGVTYTTTYGFKMPSNLPKTSIGYINECLPVVLTVELTLFENGVNSNQWDFKVNDEPIAYTRCVVSRTKTAEQNPIVNNRSTKTSVQTNTFGLDFVMPQLNTTFSDAVEDELLECDKDYAYCVYVKGRQKEMAYICTLGNSQASLDKNSNVGYNISLVEGVDDLLEYKPNVWVNFNIELSVSNFGDRAVLVRNLTPYNEEQTHRQKVYVFWGDGSFNIVEDDIMHTYEEIGNYTIRVFYSSATSNDWTSYQQVMLAEYFTVQSIDNKNYITAIPEGQGEFTIPDVLADGESVVRIEGVGDGTNKILETGFSTIRLAEGIKEVKANSINLTSLTGVSFPTTIEKIGENILTDTPYYADASHWENNSTTEGVLYLASGSSAGYLIKCGASRGGSYAIAPNTKVIADKAFYSNIRIGAIYFSNRLITIGEKAFSGCNITNDVLIPSTVKNIGNQAFYLNHITQLHIDSEDVSSGLTSITAQGHLIYNASVVFIRSDLTVGSYITENYDFESDVSGYKKFVRR